MRFLMCRPEHYGIEYEINPWMNLQKKADYDRALQQWERLHQTILSCGAKIDLIPPARGLPDMTFTANGGLLYKGKMVLPHFKVFQRQGEVAYFQAWFEQNGFEVVNRPGRDQEFAYFEGAGDALFGGNKLFVGYGFRSERAFYEKAKWFDHKNLIFCELVDPYFYHIDTCYCQINPKQAIWYPSAFSLESQKQMEKEIELIPVVLEEAQMFACNAVVIDRHIVIPSHCPKLTESMRKIGMTVHACDVDEYIKAGGACKCMTLRLD